MSDHPTTTHAESGSSDYSAVEWDDRASLHLVGQSDGLLVDATAVRRGSFAELIRQMMALPDEERRRYVIEKAGDRQYGADEVARLAQRADFPSGI